MNKTNIPKRAYRRYQRERIINKIFHRKMSMNSFGLFSQTNEECANFSLKQARMEERTHKPCSCSMCKNPRHVYRHGKNSKTIQERRIEQDNVLEEIADLVA